MKILLALLMAALPAVAQPGPVGLKLADHWKTSKSYTLAVAEQMPADQYNFKPTPAQMTFGEQMVHIANANNYFYSKMAGSNASGGYDAKKIAGDKAAVIKALGESFDKTAATLAGWSDAQLMETTDTGEGKMTRMEGVILGLEHTTHHRAQTLVYLRLKGITPTEYKY